MRFACRGLLRLAAAALAVSLGALGCSGGSATVSGKVIYNGNPLKGGNVTFISTERRPSASCPIQEDGSYTITNAPVGAVKIVVETSSFKKNQSQSGPRQYQPPPGANSPNYTPPSNEDKSKRYVQIPDQYESEEKTPLTYTVKPGDQKYDIELK